MEDHSITLNHLADSNSVGESIKDVKKLIPVLWAEVSALKELVAKLTVAASAPAAAAAAPAKAAKAADSGEKKFIRHPYRKYLLELLKVDGDILGNKARKLFPDDTGDDVDWNIVEGTKWVKLAPETKNAIKEAFEETPEGKKNAEDKAKKAKKPKAAKEAKDTKAKKGKAKAVIKPESEEEEEEEDE